MTHSTTELRKSISYDRITKDYAMHFEGVFIGCAPTYSQAEAILNQYVYDLLAHGGCETATALDGGQAEPDPTPPVDDGPDDTWGGFRQPVRRGHVHVAQPRLIARSIPISATSTVALATHPGSHNDYIALLVDGRMYDLVMSKYIIGRPEIETSLQSALDQVQAAIAELARPVFHSPAYDQLEAQAAAFDAQFDDNPDQDATPDTHGPHELRAADLTGDVAQHWTRAAFGADHGAVFVRVNLLDPDVALGRAICALRWRKYASFVAMLVNADEARLDHYAASYVAYIRSHNPRSHLSVERVLAQWQALIDGPSPAAPALERAA